MITDDNNCDSEFSYKFTRSELDDAAKALLLNKAPNYVNITYEHIIYGREIKRTPFQTL